MAPEEKDQDKTNQITFYVEAMSTDLVEQFSLADRKRSTNIDIELPNEQAEILMIFLKHRLDEPHGAGIRFQFAGRLVLS